MPVSIIVPTFNQADYLRPCLDSIWFQDYPEIEIVLVNDGSTDETAHIIDGFLQDLNSARVSYASLYDGEQNQIRRVFHSRYPEQGRRLHILTHETNRGLAAALNTGFKACTGEMCTYVPSDNICLPTMVSALARPLSENADFTYADMFIVDDAMNIKRKFELPDYSFKRCFGDWYLCGVAKMYRRKLHDRFGYYDERLLAHDHELFQRFAMGGARFFHVAQPLMYVRAHDGDREVEIHSPTNWNRLLGESKEIVMKARGFLETQPGSENQL
ncbi:glycosyltransferase family 2 protein [Desulfosarcina ovata]|uniref:Glycosyl transferase family 2 n=1 Tax=Desulfosarcina ovata subsp. ovata TaxID=2752305 RepID=A0A5K8A7D8_9BACT|nr:glycosyltransferase [Desulfosarcina ovata]BBO88318.1 glycosyl transferase family 2 [Desulfosarcina ovata subsp. ovata]